MKKVLSFVLVLAMILGSVSMAFATTQNLHGSLVFNKENAKPFEDAPNSKLATVLRDLNVLQGNDGKVFLDQTISRAEICAILMRVLGYETYCTADYAIAAASSFKDVASGYWANGYINLAAQLGYVSGIGDGKFNPTGNVGLNDGVAFIMKALGYSAEHLPLDWPYNFLVKAEELGMLKGVEQTAGDLTREQVFTMLYNVIDKNIKKWEIDDIGLIKGDATLGRWVDAGGTFATKAAGHSAAGYYRSTGEAVICPEVIADAAANKALDLSAYEGQYVEYVKNEADGSILFVSKVLSTELTGEAEFDDEDVLITFAGAKIKTLVSVDARIDENAYTLYNGGEDKLVHALKNNGEVISEADEVVMNVILNSKGEITSIASIKVWVPTDAIQITSVDALKLQTVASQEALAEEWGYTLAVSAGAAKDHSEDVIFIELVGVDSLDEIKENDVVTFYADSDDCLNKIVVAREVVEGKVSGRTAKTWTINGSKYAPLITYDDIMRVSNHAFYLDADGKIFAAKNLESSTPAKVGYSFGFITTYGSVFEQHYNADKLAIVPVTNNSISIMPLGGTEAVSFSNVSQGAMGSTTWMSDANANGKWKSTIKAGELVAYKLNAAGELTTMVQVLDGFTDGNTAKTTDAGLKNLVVATGASAGYKADVNGYNGKLFASDVQVIAVLEAANNNVVIANKTVADIKGATYAGIAYELNAAGKIAKYFVYGKAGVVSTTTKVTAAAFTTWEIVGTTKTYTTLVDGKEVPYVVTGEAVVEPAKTELYELTVNSLGQVTSFKAIASKGSVAAENCKYADGVLVTSAAGVGTIFADATTISFVSPVIYVYNKVFKAIDEAGVAAALKEATNVYVYEFDNDGYYDVLVIK